MSYKIQDIIDIDKINALLKTFSKIANIKLSIKDLDGKVLAQTKWERICTDFHGTHPETAGKCIQSDAIIVGDLKDGKKITICKCLNGLIDTASPIIVGGKHVANLFAGQFLFEAPDMEFFRKQAKEFGFDEEAYLKVVAEIPIISKSKAKAITSFIVKLTSLLGEMGLRGIRELETAEALRQERDFDKTLVNTAQTIVLVLDLEGKIVRLNPYMEEISGYSLDEVRGKDWFNTFLPEEDRESVRELFLKAAENIQTKGNVNVIVTKDGTRRDVEWYDKALTDAGGKVTGVLAVGQDISERKNTEEELRKSEERFRLLFSKSCEANLILIDGVCVDCNEAALKMLRATRDQVIGTTPADFSPERQPGGRLSTEAAEESIRECMEAGFAKFEWVHRRMDGTEFWTEVVVTAIEIGSKVALYGTWRDITDRKKAVEEITRLATVIEQAAVTIVITDLEGDIVYTNPDFEISTGYNAAEVLGQNPRLLKSDRQNQDAAFYQELWDTITAGYTWNGVFVNKRKDGVLYHEQATIFPIKDTAGKIINYAGVKRDVTGRVQAEQALQESEERYRHVVESMSDWVWEIDADGVYTYASVQVKSVLGYTSDEVLGKTPYDFMSPDEVERLRLHIRGIMMSKDHIRDLENWNITKDGRRVCLLTNAVPLINASGDLVGYRGIDRDITDRKEAQQAIKNSEQKYRMLFDGASEGILVVDIETKKIGYANHAICDMLGYTEGDLKKMDISAIHPPEEWPRVLAEFEAQARGEKMFALEIPCLREDGSIFYADINTAPVVIDDRECNVGFWTDITDRKIAEDQIFSHARFPSENPNPVMRVTGEGHVLYANKPGEMLLSLASGQQDYVVPEDWDEIVAEAMKSVDIQLAERTYGTQTFSMAFAPIADAGYVNIYAHDVTARRKLEEQLRQSEKIKMVGQLAAGVAHDFRNQLTVVKGYGEMLADAPPDGKTTREYAKIILAAVDKATTVTSQLLAFGRKESLNPKIIDMSEPISELARSLPKMVGEDIKIAITSSAKPCFASIDAILLEQAIMNLVINSRHAMPVGGELTIRSTCVKKSSEGMLEHPGFEPGFYCVVSVHDTGIGMSPETVSRIFEPFFTTKEVGMGTGMGLAMVHGFVSQSGGFVEVDSKLNEGTTFKLHFPSSGPGVEKAHEQIEIPETLPTGSETLLAVEDEELVRHILVTMLRELGYTVLEAANADEAIPLGEHYEGKISLMVTDVVMPKVDGVELAMRLRKTRPNMPVLFLSGYAQGTIVAGGMIEPWSKLLDKPIDRSKLAKAVRELIDDAKKNPS